MKNDIPPTCNLVLQIARWASNPWGENKHSILAATVFHVSIIPPKMQRSSPYTALQGTQMNSLNPVPFKRWNVGRAQLPWPAPTLKAVLQQVSKCQGRAGGIVSSHQGSSALSALVCGIGYGRSCSTASDYRAWVEEDPSSSVSAIEKNTEIRCQRQFSDSFWLAEIFGC